MEVKLSVEEYNRMFMFYMNNEGGDLFCKVMNDHIIIFAYDPESDDAIASVSLNTPEGKILSNYTECQLRISSNNDGDIFIHETCMNPDDQYGGRCDNYKVDYCRSSYSCEKGMKQKIDKLDKNINDIKFIDPIPNRNYYVTEELRRYGYVIEDLYKEFFDNTEEDVQKICETARLLLSHIKSLCEKWKYKGD